MSTHHSPYGWGAQDLNADRLSRKAPPARKVPLQRGLLIESVDGWVGEVVRAERIGGAIFFGLEDAKGRVKNYPLGTGYLIGAQAHDFSFGFHRREERPRAGCARLPHLG